MPRRFLVFIILLLSVLPVAAQQLQVERYTPANGLADARVIRIFQDKRGLLYFLTWEGISIFDGQRFENITAVNGEGIGLVNDMIQWTGDTCYVFTFQKGVYKLTGNQLLKDSLLSAIYEPNRVLPLPEGGWLIVSNGGLYNWNGQQASSLYVQPGNQPLTKVDHAVVCKDLLIYYREEGNTLNLLQRSSGKILAAQSGIKVNNITINPQQEIFIHTSTGLQQLQPAALQRNKLELKPLSLPGNLPPGFQVQSLHFTHDKLWVQQVQKGTAVMDPRTGAQQFYPSTSGITDAASLVFEDKEGNYWLTVFNKEVQKVFPAKLNRVPLPVSSPLLGIGKDDRGEIFGWTTRDFFHLSPQTSLPPAAAGANRTEFPSFSWQGQTWTFSSPARIINNKGIVISLSVPGNTDSSFFHSNRIAFDNEDRVVFCGTRLYVIERNGKVYTAPLPYFTDNMVIDKDNTYWAVSRDGSVRAYKIIDGQLQQTTSCKPIPGISPRYAIRWNTDTFCIGTRFQGIIWIQLKNGEAKEVGRITTAHGLSNNFAICLLRKNAQQLYAGTGIGLDEITLRSKDTVIQNLAATSNLYISFNWLLQNNAGKVYSLSADNQVWYIDDSLQSKAGFIPDAWFRNITVNGKTVNSGQHSFSAGQNNFSFTVTAPCFTNASNIRFDFLLKNETNRWQQYSLNNYYNINNLAPGHYTLSVTIVYPGKIYPDKTITWSFTIRPPLWKQWWFIASCILLAALIFWALIRSYYLRKLAAQKAETERRQAIEKERNRISRDMHDDLGSGLTKIAILSEVAKKQLPEPEKARAQLEIISESSRELVDNLQDIIWILNPKNDTLESLAAYIREYTLKYLEPLSIRIAFDYPEQFSITHLSEEKRRNIFLTLKESLNNIAKHAWCNAVNIRLAESVHGFELTIRDDGKGFDPEKGRAFANGLKNMKNRIEQSGGVYTLTSAPGEGTLITISMTV